MSNKQQNIKKQLQTCGQADSVLEPLDPEVGICPGLDLGLHVHVLSLHQLVLALQVGREHRRLLGHRVHKHRRNFVHLRFFLLDLLPGVRLQGISHYRRFGCKQKQILNYLLGVYCYFIHYSLLFAHLHKVNI